MSGEVQSGTYDASPDYYAVHAYTTLHLHQYYYGAIPTVRPEFALTEVYESAYIPLHSTADLQFCAAPPYCTEHTYSTIHTLYSTGPTTGWAGRPTTSFPLLRRTFIFTSCDSLYTVPSSTLVESQPPRPRHLVSWSSVFPRLSVPVETSKGRILSTDIAPHASRQRACERYVPYMYVDDQTNIAPLLAANIAIVQGLAPPRPAAEVAQEAPKPPANGNSKRITTPHACAECKRRKIRCDGRQPCGQCLGCRSPKPCYYDKHRQRVIPSRK